MRFEKYLNEITYKKPKRGGGDMGPSDEEYAARLVLPQIKKAKNEKDLQKVLDGFEKAKKRGNYVGDYVKDIVNDWIKTRKQELGLNESPLQTKGWDEYSIKKFEKTIGKKADDKGFFNACVSRMKKEMGDKAEGFCAAIKDKKYNSPMWRGKGKSKKDVKKDVKKKKF